MLASSLVITTLIKVLGISWPCSILPSATCPNPITRAFCSNLTFCPGKGFISVKEFWSLVELFPVNLFENNNTAVFPLSYPITVIDYFTCFTNLYVCSYKSA